MIVSDTYQTPVRTISSWISMNASYMCGVSLLDKCWSVTSLMIRIRQSSSPAALAFITWWLLLGKVVGDVNVTATSGLLGQDSLSWEMSSSTIMGLVMPARDQNRWFKLPRPVKTVPGGGLIPQTDWAALFRTDLHPVRQLWQLGPPGSCHLNCSGTEGPGYPE